MHSVAAPPRRTIVNTLLHPCLLSSLERAWDPWPETQGSLQTPEIDAKDPLSVAPKGQSHFTFLRKREMITPVQMTQSPCNHYLMLQQSFQLFTTEDSCATLQPGSEPETTGAHGRRQSVLFSWDFLLQVFPWNPSLPQGAGVQPLCLRGCQSGKEKCLSLMYES